MDIGVNLVESYLRLTGYFTLAEFEIVRRTEDGTFVTVTDVDIAAVRFPGETRLADTHDDERSVLLVDDPELRLQPDCVDVIIGEVKQGVAEFNPGIKDHHVLHSVLRRVEWLYATPIDEIVSDLQREDICWSEARSGGIVRSRLVAFGRSAVNDLNVISLSHIVTTMMGFFDEFEQAFRPVQFKDPAPALLRLLRKVGFDVAKPS